MSEPPHRDETPTASEPFADSDAEAAARERDDDDLEDDERTADPDLGEQDPAEAPTGPENPVDPYGSDPAT